MPARRVLVVVSDPAVLSLIAGALKDAGYEVDCASAAEECLEKAHASRPDLVVIDCEMEPRSRADILRRMRADKEHGSVPIIGLTAPRGAETEHEALETGLDDRVEIPQSPDQIQVFLDRVRRCLHLADLRAELSERNRLLNAAQKKLQSELELARMVRGAPIGSGSLKTLVGRRAVFIAFSQVGVRLLSTFLEHEGLEVEVLKPNGDLLTKIASLSPAIILIDHADGPGGGPDLCRQIKAIKELAPVPVLLLTNFADGQNRVVGRLAGADSCMRWPQTPDAMTQLVGQIRSLIR
jgi:DNA-binding response OmpR family regulator